MAAHGPWLLFSALELPGNRGLEEADEASRGPGLGAGWCENDAPAPERTQLGDAH